MRYFSNSPRMKPGSGRSSSWQNAAAGDLAGATPTLCLGPVFRRYLAYDKVRRGPAGPFESFVNLIDAEAFQRAGGSFAQLTGKGFDVYQQIMTRVVEEPYNRTYDYLVTARESSDPDRPGQVAAGSTPARPGRLLTRPGLLSPVLAATGGASLAAVLYLLRY